MVSILIFILVGVSILQICLQSAATGRRSQQAFTAYNLAKSHIEELRNLPFSSLTSSAETDTPIDESGAGDPDGIYTRTTTVTPNYTGNTGLTQVSVSVNYEIKGQTRTNPTTLTTVIYQYA